MDVAVHLDGHAYCVSAKRGGGGGGIGDVARAGLLYVDQGHGHLQDAACNLKKMVANFNITC